MPSSPQVACLQGVRQSDIVVLVLGEGYGPVQPGSGLSATHEEYREARGTKQVLAFVQHGVAPEPRQAEFIAEVQGWEGGLFRGGFADAEELQGGIIRALHDVALNEAFGSADPDELAARASSVLPAESRNMVVPATVDLVVAAGLRQQVLRPVEIEAPALADHLLQAALFGPDRLFSSELGNQRRLDGGVLSMAQEGGAALSLAEDSSIVIRQPLDQPLQRNPRGMDLGATMVVIQETVQQRLATALGFAEAVLDRIDATERITHVGVAAQVAGAEHRAWRTRAQNDTSPGSVSMGMGARDRGPVVKVVRRAALRVNRARLVVDLLVPLRRHFPWDDNVDPCLQWALPAPCPLVPRTHKRSLRSRDRSPTFRRLLIPTFPSGGARGTRLPTRTARLSAPVGTATPPDRPAPVDRTRQQT